MKEKNSFTSAENDIPIKLLFNDKVFTHLKNKNFKPMHVQLYPTNKCNLNCEFCSCANRDRNAELDLHRIKYFFLKWKNTIQACTLSGGGEPLMYKEFEGLIDFFNKERIKIGMATNGLLLNRYSASIYDNFTWIRISLSKHSLTNNCLDKIENSINSTSKCDWAFSFVCSEDVREDYKSISEFINKYNNKVTHFRIVNDLLNLDNRVSNLRKILIENNINTDKVIFQDRIHYSKGRKECLISLIRPIISPEGNIYPCCGVQYAKFDSNRTFPVEMNMGSIEECNFTEHFDGETCDMCYYDGYNKLLIPFTCNYDHLEFI